MRHAYGVLLAMVCVAAWVAGCSSGGAPLTMSVGNYNAPPPGAAKARVGLVELNVEAPTTQPFALGSGGSTLGEVAADELATLLAKSGRFDVVGRIALKQSLDQQGLSDMLRDSALVKPAKIEGVEYVLVGNLNNLSITKKPATPSAFGKMKSWVQQSAQNKQVQIAATCNVGWKLIEPVTGDVVLSNNSQFARTGPASDFGIDVLQAAASQSADAELPVSEDDREQIVRLSLDDAVRKSLTKIDRFLQSRGGLQQGTITAAPSAKSTTQVAPAAPAPAPSGAARSQQTPPAALPKSTPGKVCPACGALNDPVAKFCKRCGGNL